MTPTNPPRPPAPHKPIRWWPGILLFAATVGAVVWVRWQTEWPFQKRNLTTAQIVIVAAMLLVIWWTFLSRAPKRLRLGVTFTLVGMMMVCAAMFRLRGMSGDMAPIVEFRWANHELPRTTAMAVPTNGSSALQLVPASTAADFPQFYGPHRDGVLPGPALATDWTAQPPQVLWRQKAGAAWSGFAIVGDVCLTQEQRGDEECVVAYELASGRQLWLHADKARYNTTIAGEGPRATPTVVSNRVFTLGATGILNCLDLATGRPVWSHPLLAEFGGKVPNWGCARSPLVVDDLVIVQGGEDGGPSLFAFRIGDGALVWKARGDPGYAALKLATLAGVPQVLALNNGSVAAYDPATGKTLWERPWGNGNVSCTTPVVVSSNRVLFSSGYGVGAELLEISQRPNGTLAAGRIWKSIRMKAKFAHLFLREGCVFGLDDGMFAGVDLRDGSQRWKEGRYGHGQGLLVGDVYLLMAESGELVLLRPTPAAPNELARFRVFKAKTWNPLALAGDRLLVRNDQEIVCLRLPLAP